MSPQGDRPGVERKATVGTGMAGDSQPPLAEAEAHERQQRIARARQTAASALNLRRRREQALGASLFAEPAWDMLLDLYLRQSEGLRTTVSSACLGSAAPPTTALRHMAILVERGLVERRSALTCLVEDRKRRSLAEADGRRSTISATAPASPEREDGRPRS